MNILIDHSVGEMTTPLWFFDVFFHISLGHFLYELFHRNFLILMIILTYFEQEIMFLLSKL